MNHSQSSYGYIEISFGCMESLPCCHEVNLHREDKTVEKIKYCHSLDILNILMANQNVKTNVDYNMVMHLLYGNSKKIDMVKFNKYLKKFNNKNETKINSKMCTFL